MQHILDAVLAADRRLMLAGTPEGFDALILADLARAAHRSGPGRPLLHIAREESRLEALRLQIAFFAPEIETLAFPAWDSLPYDRVSPHSERMAQRMATLARLAARTQDKRAQAPLILLTTVSAAVQRVPTRAFVSERSFGIRIGARLAREDLMQFLALSGYQRATQVAEPGEFAPRGGLIDIFPPGDALPARIDFFGDEVEQIRRFDPLTQRTSDRIAELELLPVSEFALDPDSVRRFRKAYVASFGAVTGDDPLYEAISAGRSYQGAEHWLPLFHERLETLFDHVGHAVLTLDHQAPDAARERFESINDYYHTRAEAAAGDRKSALASPYKPLPPGRLYLNHDEWDDCLDEAAAALFSPFAATPDDASALDCGGRIGRNFAPERLDRNINIYDALGGHVAALMQKGKRAVFAAYSSGARDRLATVLEDHGIGPVAKVEGWADLRRLPARTLGMAVLPLEHGFETDALAIITEEDVLGDRLIRKSTRSRKADDFLRDATALSPGDLVVHVDHGVGRFEGLETIEVQGAPHDCVALVYRDGDRLYLPVENIELLSRYGSEGSGELDKLGGHGWQARKARMKKRIREMADALIKVAAERSLRTADRLEVPSGLMDEFAARFPYAETEDQLRAIEDVASDLASGRPMDRLVCGDVGFGKTEVALRAAFIAALSGHQVAVIAPTTLLARQHMQTFTARFHGLPVRIGQLSRLVSAREAKTVREGMKDGSLDIVIGTHALLGKGIAFKRLGLLIIDEEQHFGVAHKERLKQLKADVHVLTLTATPIPRTLQLAMSGLRDLSLIATPPVDRLAVRTFVTPFDPITVREALLREHFRGGQSFFVVPRIADLEEMAAFLRDEVPEVRFVMAHGQMTPGEIEDRMTAFYEGQHEVLLSTSIVESGLDIPRVNTLIVHRADMFGLAQLYQLRGRVGRSKLRAYAWLTHPANRTMTEGAIKRLEVLQSLDTLGAGFTLASHDMDIRGAGNLLGTEQSGHIREVGVELYQQMLEEAVAEARRGDGGTVDEDGPYSPQINVGASVLIPESYVGDLDLRMALYRRLGDLADRAGIDAFAAELIDRFGPLPAEVRQLLAIIEIKIACLAAGIARIDAGQKGITIAFYKDRFANPGGLVDFLSRQKVTAKLRPDHKLVFLARVADIEKRLKVVRDLARGLQKLVET
ncbi:MAG: transcription-repair coupling factor [Rhodothalassiaceae bacterium]